jgi:Na+/melibiose symporter-like transporter
MIVLTVAIAIVYAPTIALIWAIYADVADYSEWKIGRRFTGMVYATIGFGLKAGLALGSAAFLWLMVGFFQYDSQGSPLFTPGTVNDVASLSNVPKLAARLNEAKDPVSAYVKGYLWPETRQELAAFQPDSDPLPLEKLLLADFNRIVAGSSIYESNRFAGVKLRKGTQEVAENAERMTPSAEELMSLNRSLLEDAFPTEISGQRIQTPKSKRGFRVMSGVAVGVLFAVCTVLLMAYPLSKRTTIQMADELAERRKKSSLQTT